MKLPAAIVVAAGVMLSLHAMVGEATLSMLMNSMRSNQRYESGGGGTNTYGGYGSYYATTTKAPTLGSIIGSAIDGLQTLKGMVMNPMMDMAANLMMMASSRATTPAPTTYAPMTYAAVPSITYAPSAGARRPQQNYMSSTPDMYGYYSSGGSNFMSGTKSTPVYSQDYSDGQSISNSKNDDDLVQSPAAQDHASSKDYYAGTSYGKYGVTAATTSASTFPSYSSSSTSSGANKVKRSSKVASSTDINSDVSIPAITYVGSAGNMKKIETGIWWPKPKRLNNQGTQ